MLKRSIIIFLLISSTFLSGGLFENSFAYQYLIPAWVKNNAKWWSNGQIEDSDFIKGIQYLINSGIIVVPETKSSSSVSSHQIPEWIRNNAGWWAEGKISDDDFVLGIQYLIGKGIIRVHSDNLDSKQEPVQKLSVTLEGRTMLNLGDTQFITVKVTDEKGIVKDAFVSAKVTYAYGDVVKKFEGTSNYYGEFRFSWKIEGFTPGTYTVKIDADKSGYTSASGLFSFKVLDL